MKNEVVQLVENNDSHYLVSKAEIDMQISTAKAFPRDIKKFVETSIVHATLNQDVAESCTYTLPRGKDNISGPSVRLAEIMLSNFGNVRAGMRVISNDGKTITAQGICHDLESNTCITMEVSRSILNKQGLPYSNDMQVMTGNAACAIAFRNAVYKVIPAAFVDVVHEKVKELAKGSETDLEKRRSIAVNWFKSKGATEIQICKKLEVASIELIDLDKLSILSGYKSAITNNEITVVELFSDSVEDKKAEIKERQNTTEKTEMP